MKIVIPGGSGQVGTLLRRTLVADGHEVVVLSRDPKPGEVHWDGENLGAWAEALEGADAVINLAGRSVNCRYTEANRRAIVHSRVASTAAVGRAIAACTVPPRVWAEFMRALRDGWGDPCRSACEPLDARSGAVFLRTETELILKSRRVVPGRLLDAGFGFLRPTWPEAARELCAEWRRQRGRTNSS